MFRIPFGCLDMERWKGLLLLKYFRVSSPGKFETLKLDQICRHACSNKTRTIQLSHLLVHTEASGAIIVLFVITSHPAAHQFAESISDMSGSTVNCTEITFNCQLWACSVLDEKALQ